MKLGAMVCVVGALSLAACVDEGTVGGGQGDGIQSSKIPDKGPEVPMANPVGSIQARRPAHEVCDDCTMTSHVSLDARYSDVHIVENGLGEQLCAIYERHGVEVINECGVSLSGRPERGPTFDDGRPERGPSLSVSLKH